VCLIAVALVLCASSGVSSQSPAVSFTVAAETFTGGVNGCWEGPFQCGGGYYDETPGNWGDAQVRPGTDVDLWHDDGGIVIGGLDGLEWVTFPVNVPQSGQYTVTFRTASPADRPDGSGVINVGIHGVDGSWVGNQHVPVTGGPGEWHTYVSWNAPRTIYLPAGQQTLTMWASGGWYNVRNMQFTLNLDSGERFEVTGVVTNEDGVPVAGAVVTMAHWLNGFGRGASTVSDTSGAYRIGFSATTLWDPPNRFVARGQVVAEGYELYWRSLTADLGVSNLVGNFPLYAIRRIAAGDSIVAAFPSDIGDCTGWVAQRCGIVRVTVPSAGTLTVEVTPTDQSGGQPTLQICCVSGDEIYGNPLTLPVHTLYGNDWAVLIALRDGSKAAESFVVKTSFRRN
jgi:Carbohydrate binding module (family 6)